MTDQQQYRVHACNNTEPHEAHEFRGTYRKPSLPGVEITETFQCEGIERPEPTTCTCPPPATHMEDGPDQDCPKHGDRVSPPLVQIVSPRATGKRSALLDAVLDRADERGIQVQVVPSPSLPTREQIAVTLHANGTSYTAEKWGDLPPRYRAMLTKQADAVLALLQKGADR